MIEKDFISNLPESIIQLKKGSITWKSPSNIALVKYWGKTEPQIPKNPSISFTLENCHTTTELFYELKENPSHEYDFKVFLDQTERPDFVPKIRQFFERIENYVPFIKQLKLEIRTKNSFPHSSGIASSASGMSALALCLMSLERILDPNMTENHFINKSSFLSRLGSGSAARSIEGPLVVWGNHQKIKGSTDLFGSKYPYEIHPVFKTYHDTVLLVDKGVKQVSSTIGHQLMNGHPFAEARFEQANNHLSQLIPILKDGNLPAFIEIVEREALSLHAMMMTSDPYFMLMKPNTLEIIDRIWSFRKQSGTGICFTLDAGANVHVLYPDKDQKEVNTFIISDLIQFCEKNQYICDKAGAGAVRL